MDVLANAFRPMPKGILFPSRHFFKSRRSTCHARGRLAIHQGASVEANAPTPNENVPCYASHSLLKVSSIWHPSYLDAGLSGIGVCNNLSLTTN
jgi:hypothetical protein